MEQEYLLFYKIENYIKGKLPPDEAAAFEKEIENNPELAEMVEMQRFEEEGMEQLVEQDLREKIREWDKIHISKGNNKKGGNFKRFLGISLLIVAILAAIYFLFTKKNDPAPGQPNPVEETQKPETNDNTPAVQPEEPPKPEEPEKKNIPLAEIEKERLAERKNDFIALAETSYSKDEKLLRGDRSDDKESILAPGLEAFANGQLETAIREFNKISKTSHPTEYEIAREYLAHAYFQNRQFNRSARLFESLAEDNQYSKGEFEWYQLLSLVGDYISKKSQADDLLQKIISDDLHSYQQSASDLKAALEKITR